MAITMLGSGFLILQNQIPAWLNWVFWLSPLQYAMTGMANNEYSGGSYDRLVPVENEMQRLGDVVLQQYQFNIADKYRYVRVASLPLVQCACLVLSFTNSHHSCTRSSLMAPRQPSSSFRATLSCAQQM
jgi:hypothetical protein